MKARAARHRREAREAREGSSSGWVIPGAIVMCESSGQNLPPNEASAAGYYQITSETWAEAVSTGHASPPDNASEHSKEEQDRAAAWLWAGGAGAGRWVCKA
jgi:hypothetical protein